MKPEEAFKDRELEQEKTNYYQVEVKCANCGFEKWFLEIPVGIPYKQYLKNEICPKCGCKMIEEKETWRKRK